MKPKVLVSQTTLSVILILALPVLASGKARPRIDNPTMRLADRIAPKYGVPAKVLKTIVCVESSCGENPVPRRETSKSWAKRARKIAKSNQHYEELMHSYGATQLSGLYTFLEYGIEPKELFDDETNLEIASARLAKTLESCRGSHYCAFARWNGGARPNKQAREYARRALKIEETV